jgi:methyl-accepting chemotaxis protein
MSPFSFKSIKVKLLAAFIVMGVVPLVVLTLLLTRQGRNQMHGQLGQELFLQARTIADAVSAYADEKYVDTQAFTEVPAARDTPAEATKLMNDDMQARGAGGTYSLMMLAGKDGKIVAASTVDGDGKPLDTAGLVGRDVRGEEWFEKIASGAIPRTGAYVGPLCRDPVVAQFTHDTGATFIVAAGVYDDKGQLVRVWANRASWDHFATAVTDAAARELETHGVPTASVSLVDSKGMTLAHDDHSLVLKVNQVDAKSAGAVASVTGKAGVVDDVDPGDGAAAVAAYTPVPGFGGQPPNGWSVIVRGHSSEVDALASPLRDFGLVVAALAGALLLVAAWVIARNIARPISATVVALERVAEGDLTARAPVVGRDEVAGMGKALNHALERLSAAFSKIGAGVVGLTRSSVDLTAIGTTMSASADETSRQAGVVAAASEEAGKNVQTVATGTEEMSVTIKEIAKNAAEAAKVATSAVGSAQRTNALVTKLGESSAEIGNVLKVITSIAEQTNLLALNATIEAARAGEAGKGFAVVANEVKELAKETAKATEDITRKIEVIQSDTQSAVAAIGEITAVIGQINDIQNTIASSVEEQAATTNEIGRNLHELAAASNDIAQNVTNVAAAASSTADCSTQTRSAATALAELSRSLDAQMAQFKFEQPRSGQGSSEPRGSSAAEHGAGRGFAFGASA